MPRPAAGFRPSMLALEAREVPTVSVLAADGSLTLRGSPNTGPGDALTVTHTGDNQFAVRDGRTALGSFRVTQSLSLRLDGFDTLVGVDLRGASLRGDVLLDLGAGDRTPASTGFVFLNNSKGAAKVSGDVTVRGGAGTETVSLAANGAGATLTVGGVRAVGRSVTTPIEDTLSVGKGVTVAGDLTTRRYTYTTINGTVAGDVRADAADSPGGMGFQLDGTVRGDVIASGGVTAPDTADTVYYSFARINGRVEGDVRFDLTGGRASAAVSGSVGGDWTVRHTGGGPAYVGLEFPGVVRGDLAVVADNDAATDQTTVELLGGVVFGDFRFRQTGEAGNSLVMADGYVAGDATIRLGGAGTTSGSATFAGVIGGSAIVTGESKTAAVSVYGFNGYAEFFGAPGVTTVTRDLTVRLGDGQNSLTVEQYPDEPGDPLPPTVGGTLTYKGGGGADVVSVSGRFGFRAKIDTGGGDDTVSMAPDAIVGTLDIDFGTKPGTRTWTPPTTISFPLTLKNLS